MNYRLQHALNMSNNAKSTIWMADHAKYVGEAGNIDVAMVGDQKRRILSGLHLLARIYMSELEERKKLGHDCVTFAYSWESGDAYTKTRAFSAGGQLILPRTVERLTDDLTSPPQTQAGEIVYTVDTPIERAADMEAFDEEPGAHFMIHATVDEGEPLYLSKFGSVGAVILTSFEQSLQLYPAQTAGVVHGFETRM